MATKRALTMFQLFKHLNVSMRSFKFSTGIQNYNPIVICGPSGVGKGTLVNHLLDQHSSHFGTSISHTTRAPRQGEQNDIHYRFIDKQLFEEGIANNEYIEYAATHGNYYGTHQQSLDRLRKDGKICVLEIDVKGAKQIKDKHDNLGANFVFVTCEEPLNTLEKRLKGRGTENDQQIQTRLDTARSELEFVDENPHFFDHILYNEDLDGAVSELKSLLNSWYPWLKL